ncbi:zinc-binding protein A33-like [Hemibagrus wyckioides]|uniref:zinc-binding protein A33-like n=1 Tax=Hemibagrus wyckioides TaxID=337641 RepID=UPI00266C8198|nr:zinc-binding protein A33-like [Hemibagrus wyckioides]
MACKEGDNATIPVDHPGHLVRQPPAKPPPQPLVPAISLLWRTCAANPSCRAEPMQLSKTWISTEEHHHCLCLQLCFYCAQSEHSCAICPRNYAFPLSHVSHLFESQPSTVSPSDRVFSHTKPNCWSYKRDYSIKKNLAFYITPSELKRIQQYAVDVTLEPHTAHNQLILSHDGKQVKCGHIEQNLPDNPERFNYVACVLGKEGFSSGKFYYKVQVGGNAEWDLGIARESANRKGQNSYSPQDGYWCVWLRNETEYEAGESTHVRLSLKQAPQKVGVFVDYEGGLISFYDVDAKSHIYSFTGQTFTEKLYPYFSPCCNGNQAPLCITL